MGIYALYIYSVCGGGEVYHEHLYNVAHQHNKKG